MSRQYIALYERSMPSAGVWIYHADAEFNPERPLTMQEMASEVWSVDIDPDSKYPNVKMIKVSPDETQATYLVVQTEAVDDVTGLDDTCHLTCWKYQFVDGLYA